MCEWFVQQSLEVPLLDDWRTSTPGTVLACIAVSWWSRPNIQQICHRSFLFSCSFLITWFSICFFVCGWLTPFVWCSWTTGWEKCFWWFIAFCAWDVTPSGRIQLWDFVTICLFVHTWRGIITLSTRTRLTNVRSGVTSHPRPEEIHNLQSWIVSLLIHRTHSPFLHISLRRF